MCYQISMQRKQQWNMPSLDPRKSSTESYVSRKCSRKTQQLFRSYSRTMSGIPPAILHLLPHDTCNWLCTGVGHNRTSQRRDPYYTKNRHLTQLCTLLPSYFCDWKVSPEHSKRHHLQPLSSSHTCEARTRDSFSGAAQSGLKCHHIALNCEATSAC